MIEKEEIKDAMRKELEVVEGYKDLCYLQAWLRAADVLTAEQLQEKLIEIQGRRVQ